MVVRAGRRWRNRSNTWSDALGLNYTGMGILALRMWDCTHDMLCSLSSYKSRSICLPDPARKAQLHILDYDLKKTWCNRQQSTY